MTSYMLFFGLMKSLGVISKSLVIPFHLMRHSVQIGNLIVVVDIVIVNFGFIQLPSNLLSI